MDFTNITAEELEKLFVEDRITLQPIMTGQWQIKFGEEKIGEILTDTFKNEQIVSVGGRELGRFTDR